MTGKEILEGFLSQRNACIQDDQYPIKVDVFLTREDPDITICAKNPAVTGIWVGVLGGKFAINVVPLGSRPETIILRLEEFFLIRISWGRNLQHEQFTYIRGLGDG